MKRSREKLVIYNTSIINLIKELKGLCKLVVALEDPDEKDELLKVGIDEICYNTELMLDETEYLSDEYSYLANKEREC